MGRHPSWNVLEMRFLMAESAAQKRDLSIIHVNTHDVAGGAAKVAWRLADAQRKAGLDSKMLAAITTDRSGRSFAFEPEADRNLQAYCRQQGQLFYEYQGSHRLVKNPRVQSADILHLHNLHGHYFNPFSISALSHIKPVVWTLHDMQSITGHCAHSFDCTKWQEGCRQCPYLNIEPALKTDSASQLLADKKLVYDHSYLWIVTPSQWLKSKVEKSILRDHPVELIYNGVDTGIFRPYDKKQVRGKWGIPEDVFVIGAVGHGGTLTNQWKGGQDTQQALEVLWSQLPGCMFVNIGANDKSADSRIIHIPTIHDENELAQAYSVLDIFLYTPAADNCPLVVLEALSCGVPIVTFATGGVPELVRDGQDGFVTACKDVSGLVRAVKILAADRPLRDRFGGNCRQAAVTKFDHGIIAGRYEKLYRDILHKNQYLKRTVKLFPLPQVPQVIRTPAFIEAEKCKADLAGRQIAPQMQEVLVQSDRCDVSIVLATKDRAKLLDMMLSSLKEAAEGIRYEVIVVEGGSCDKTPDVLRQHGITQIYNEAQCLGPGRHSWPQLYNFGFSRACGKWAMYASDDIVFGKESVRRAVDLLNRQTDDVAGGIFFYKNAKAEPGWDQFGIDFTYGPKLLMNYGLVRLDDFNRVGGLDSLYKFYCADGDLCYKLYQSGKQLIPLPGCFVVHNNVLDVQKKVNVDNSGSDIELYKQKWKHFVSMETPNPRRLLWQDDMQHNTHTDKNDILRQIKKLGLWNESGSLCLHLGCGQQHLKGYVNIDYPPSEHTVQKIRTADIFADFTQLDFPSRTVDEIRLHHVFEHFDRPAALALLCKWHDWLKTGGRLVIETPDFDASIDLIRSGRCSYSEKQAILRHLFGSHEADWAVHKDGWNSEKFQSVLGRLGFDNIRIELSSWGVTRNVTALAVKSRVLPAGTLTDAAKQILGDSMIDQSESEQRQWDVWCRKLEEALNKGRQSGSKPPHVSIYMSMYNMGKYLAETLDSILNQTFSDFELVVADDGSDDNSVEILKAYQQRDSRIKMIELPHVGVVKARNEALNQCNPRAVYLMNHDSDDISLPDKLRRLVEYLGSNPRIAIVGCFAEYFGDETISRGRPHLEWRPEEIRRTFGDLNSMIHSAALMRRTVVETIGNYRQEFPAAEDYDFFARALMSGFECANIPEVLHKIRLHRQSLGSVKREVLSVCAEKVSTAYRHYLRAGAKTEIFKPSNKSCLSILHTVEFYAPHTGGAEEVVQQISERLAKRGHRVTVATTKLPQRNFGELNGVRILEFDIAGNYARGFQGLDINQYVQLVRSDQFDVMFNYAAQQWATDLAFAGLESAATKRVNVIAPCGYSALSDAKTLRLPQYAKYFNAIIPTCLPRYDAAVYHSAMYKDYEFAANHGFTNSIVIPNGTSEEEFSIPSNVDFRQKYGISTRYLGLCVANFFPGKGHPTVIEAVRQMRRPDFTLVFIGKEGQLLHELQNRAAGLNIRFCVNIPRQDTIAAHQAADIFLFGSEIEASPLVIIEAKASRTPFVTTDVGNVREWKGGIVCAPEKMAYYAATLLDNEPMRKTLAEEGFSEWKDKLTWESVADRYEQLYLSLKNAKHKGLRNDFNHFQQRPGAAAPGDNRVVSAALSGH
jgi:glycosyltransferase involved in cell wall biosynthesis/predicted SAM-dependent methyltransferase